MDKPLITDQAIIDEFMKGNNPSDGFEAIYARAGDTPTDVPWVQGRAHPYLESWVIDNQIDGQGKTALMVGCGVGDGAELLAAHGFQVTAFDISKTAIAWCKQRFPESKVDYQVADMFNPPAEWIGAFDLVAEVFIVQALPLSIREDAISAETQFVAPDGQLLIVTMSRPDEITEPVGPPWALSKIELSHFETCGLQLVQLDDLPKKTAHYRTLYQRPA